MSFNFSDLKNITLKCKLRLCSCIKQFNICYFWLDKDKKISKNYLFYFTTTVLKRMNEVVGMWSQKRLLVGYMRESDVPNLMLYINVIVETNVRKMVSVDPKLNMCWHKYVFLKSPDSLVFSISIKSAEKRKIFSYVCKKKCKKTFVQNAFFLKMDNCICFF